MYEDLKAIADRLEELNEDSSENSEYWSLQERFKPMLEAALLEQNLVQFTKPQLFDLMCWIGTHRPVPLHTVFSSFSLARKYGLPE